MDDSKGGRWIYVVSYAFASFALGVVSNAYGASTAFLAKLAGCSEDGLLPVVAGIGICFLLGGLPGSYALDRPAISHIVFAGCVLMQAVTLAAVPFCTSVICITSVFSLQALTDNFIAAGTMAFAMQLFPEKQNLVVNIICAASGLGSTSVGIYLTIIGTSFGNMSFGYYSTACALAAICVGVYFVGSPAALPKPEEVGISWKRLCSYNWGIVAPTLLSVFANIGMQSAYATWVYTYALLDFKLDEGAAGYVNSSFWASFTVGGVLSTSLSHYLSPETILFLMMPLVTLGSLAATLLPPSAHSLATLALCSVAVGLGTAAGLANTLAVAARMLDGQLDGLLTAMCVGSAALGSAIMGVALPHRVLMWGMTACSATVLLMVAVVLAVGRSQARQRLRAALQGDREPLLDGGGDAEEGLGLDGSGDAEEGLGLDGGGDAEEGVGRPEPSQGSPDVEESNPAGADATVQ